MKFPRLLALLGLTLSISAFADGFDDSVKLFSEVAQSADLRTIASKYPKTSIGKMTHCPGCGALTGGQVYVELKSYPGGQASDCHLVNVDVNNGDFRFTELKERCD